MKRRVSPHQDLCDWANGLCADSPSSHELPPKNPRIETRVEGDKVIVTATMFVELDHLGRPWRIPVRAPTAAGGRT